jgi:hypothetical protein
MNPALTGDHTTDSHPITVMVLRVLRKGRKEAYEIDDVGARTLHDSFAKYLDANTVAEAATCIANLAYFLDEKKSCTQAAGAILKVAETVVLALEARGVDTGVARARLLDVGQRFNLFQGNKAGVSAPRLGEAAPSGSVKAGNLGGGGRRV